MKQPWIAVVLAAATASLCPAAAGAAPAVEPPPQHVKGCGELIVDSPNWVEYTDGQESAYGDHWRVSRWDDRGQNEGSCDYATTRSIQLIESSYSGANLPWGVCAFGSEDTSGVVVEPFYFVNCAVVQHYRYKGKRRTRIWYFEVDADPAYTNFP